MVGKIVIGVTVALTVGLFSWFVPYEVEHHVMTNNAAIEVYKVRQEFDEYRLYQEYQYLKSIKHRELTSYEKARLRQIERELDAITRRAIKDAY